MQDFDIFINERAVVFFLTEIESGVIRGSYFAWSFHVGCPSFLGFVRGMDADGEKVLEIDFAAVNGKLCSVGSGWIEWRDGTVLS